MSSTTLSHGGLISLNPMNSMDPVCAYSKLRTDSLWVPRILAELRGLPLPPGLPRDAGEARPERDPARRALLEARTSLQNDALFCIRALGLPWALGTYKAFLKTEATRLPFRSHRSCTEFLGLWEIPICPQPRC